MEDSNNVLKPTAQVQIGDVVVVKKNGGFNRGLHYLISPVTKVTATQFVTKNDNRFDKATGKMRGVRYTHGFIPTPEFLDKIKEEAQRRSQEIEARDWLRNLPIKKPPVGAIEAMRKAHDEWMAANSAEAVPA